MPTINFEQVLVDSSRVLADYAAAMVGRDPELFGQVMELALLQKKQVSMRAARVADLACEKHPELIRPHLVTIVRVLPKVTDTSVRRVFLHILLRHPWVEDDEGMGRLVDTLFKWLAEDSQPTAVKAYSLYLLEELIVLIPELKNELIVTLEDCVHSWNTAALRSCGRHSLKRLRK
jgi:hypothetical protein